MITVSIDTCTGRGSALLLVDDNEAASTEDLRGTSGDSTPLQTISELIRSEGLDFRTVNEIVVTRGPGSFTGVRSGLSLLRGFLRARQDLECSTCSVFEAMAVLAPADSTRFKTAIFAGREDVAVQEFVRNELDGKVLAKAPHVVVPANSFCSEAVVPVIYEKRLGGLFRNSKAEIGDSALVAAPDNIARLAYKFVRSTTPREFQPTLDPIYTRDFIAGTS